MKLKKILFLLINGNKPISINFFLSTLLFNLLNVSKGQIKTVLSILKLSSKDKANLKIGLLFLSNFETY